MRRYLEVWRLPGAPVLIMCSLLGRLPVTMLPLALLSAVQVRTGSWAPAGFAVGAYTVSLAIVAPIMGRLVDRLGPRPVLLVTGLLHLVALVGLVVLLKLPVPIGVVYAGAAAAGGTFPVIASTVRTIWSRLAAPGTPERSAAFALDSVTGEISWVLGPLIVAGAIVVATPASALLLAAVLCIGGTVAVTLSGAVRGWEARPVGTTRGGGPLRAPGMPVLLGGVSLLMLCFGILEVALPAHAVAIGMRPLSGVFLAVWSAGSACSGIWFGTRHITRPLAEQWRWGLLGVAVVSLPLIAAPGLWITPVAFAVGLAIAPVIIVQNGLVAQLAPPGTTTEAYTWVTTVAFGASSLGTAVGGLVVEQSIGVPGAFALASGAAAAAWLCAYLGRGIVRHSPPVTVMVDQ